MAVTLFAGHGPTRTTRRVIPRPGRVPSGGADAVGGRRTCRR